MAEGEHRTLDVWWCLRSEPGEAAWNMALDEALLHAVAGLGQPVLRFYAWAAPAATFGYSQRFAQVQEWTSLRPLVRRPTGGGLVPHGGDWTYSVVVPPAHAWYALKARASYCRLHTWIRAALGIAGLAVDLAPHASHDAPGRCFVAGAEEGDVLWQGRKIAGAAQRRSREGLLVQGSIQPPADAPERARFENAMLDVASRQYGVEWRPLPLEQGVLDMAAGLVASRYGLEAFNAGR